jgi:hypothetical protein
MRQRTTRTYHGPDRPDKRLLSAEELPAPSVAIRAHCLECLGWELAEVRRCKGDRVGGRCPLWPHRMGGRAGAGSPGKAIRAECLWCMGGQKDAVAECWSPRCALWPYRFGSSPRTNRRARAKFDAGKPAEGNSGTKTPRSREGAEGWTLPALWPEGALPEGERRRKCRRRWTTGRCS